MGASIYTQILWWGFGAGEFGRWMDISPGNHLLWLIHKQQHPRGLVISRHWSHPKCPRRRWVHAKKILEIWNSGLFTKGGCFTQNQILRTFWHGPNALVDILDRTKCPARGQARGDRPCERTAGSSRVNAACHPERRTSRPKEKTRIDAILMRN